MILTPSVTKLGLRLGPRTACPKGELATLSLNETCIRPITNHMRFKFRPLRRDPSTTATTLVLYAGRARRLSHSIEVVVEHHPLTVLGPAAFTRKFFCFSHRERTPHSQPVGIYQTQHTVSNISS
jgi:hypothetical protein